jgi:Cupin domain
VVLAAGEQTVGAFTLIHNNSDAFTVAWHTHEGDEAFYVLEGCYAVRCEEDSFEDGPGTFFFLPRNAPHEQIRPDGGRAQADAQHSRRCGGLFRDMAEAINSGTKTPERRQQIAQTHGMCFLDEGGLR